MVTAGTRVSVRLDRNAIVKIGQRLGAEIVSEPGVRPYLARKVRRKVLGITTPLTYWGEPLATEDFDGFWISLDPEVEIYTGILPESKRRQDAVNRTVAKLFANSQVV